jgi:prephenate dehydrogenase
MFQSVGIIGVGLIGGSLGLAIKRSASGTRVLGIGRNRDKLELAQKIGAIDTYALEKGACLRECDLVVLATPVDKIEATLENLGGYFKDGAIVTDVGSTKRAICVQAWQCLPSSVEFIGGHPVAGREVAGVENSAADLFRNAPYVLCPRPGIATEKLSRLRSLIEQFGAHAMVMDPVEHDRTMAWVSHLPQLVSTALAAVMSGKATEISGSGLRDMTRLAASPYSVWKGIIESNADNIDAALQAYVSELESLRVRLKTGRLSEDFSRAVEFCRKLQRPAS